MLLVLLAASIPPVLLRHQSLTIVPFLNLLDGSWVLDTSYKAATGVWFGRDVIFTYGPLYQWLSSAPSRWIGVSTGTILANANMLPTFVSILATFVGMRLFLPKVSPWRRALFLAVVLWSPPNIRQAICLFAFLIFVRLADAVACRAGGVVLPGLGAAILCLACFLVSADAGLYCVAAFLFCLAATAIVEAKTPRAVIRLCAFLVATGVGLAIYVVATNAVISSPLDFSYWKSSLALATSYRWFESKPLTDASTRRLLGALALGIAVFGAAWWRREPDEDYWTLRPAFLLSGFCLALLMMQSGLVRSDVVHVVWGIYPMVFLSGTILIGAPTNVRWLSAILVVILVATTQMITTSHAEYSPNSVWQGARKLFRPNLACPEGKQEFDHACFAPPDAQLFTTVSGYVDQHTSPGDPILVFPYQNAFGVMSRRRVAGGVLQAYLANGDYLTDLDLAELRKASPPFGLYLPESGPTFGLQSPDGIYSYSLDGVPSFTRSPGVWFYLLRHYRSDGGPAPSVLGLVRDDTRDQRLAFTEEKIADALGTVRVTKRRTLVDLGQVHWPAAEASFLKFRFRVDYPFWWKVRKPSSLALLMSFADGSQKWTAFVVEPNHDSEVWIYPGEAKEMGGYFSSDDSRWPIGKPLASLTLVISPFDWVSVSPESVSIEAVAAVRASIK